VKQSTVKSVRGSDTVPAATTEPEPNAARNLEWVEEVAELLPEESRLGWYRNVRPWLRTLSPDDEIAHLAYSMGYLALLTRSAPALVAAERVKLATSLQRLTDEVTGAVKTTAQYHQKLTDRLNGLPAEIAQGLSPNALAAEIVTGVREQFRKSGIPEAGRLLREQEDTLRLLAAEQAHILAGLREQLNDLRSRAKYVLDSVAISADSAKKSIDQWNSEMRKVQWIPMGWTLLTGLLLGVLLYWWVVDPHRVGTSQPAPVNQTEPHATAASGKTSSRTTK
jgi:ElaB/YqjD/DUF883 family membrane-anchored ribosome-binding protein